MAFPSRPPARVTVEHLTRRAQAPRLSEGLVPVVRSARPLVRTACPGPFLCSAPRSLLGWSWPMHRADVLGIGPLEPLLPRPICVRLGVVVAGAAALVCVALAAALVIALQLDLLPVSVPESLAGV